MVFLIALTFLTSRPIHAERPMCSGYCATFQIGPEAQREIRQTDRAYQSNTRLVQKVQRVTGDNFDELQNACEDRGRKVSWWHPASDQVVSYLVSELRVDRRDDVHAVIKWSELEECQPLMPGFEFGTDTMTNHIDSIEESTK